MGAQTPGRDEILRAMRKAADFYRSKVSTEGGCHYYYTADLSYGRSESAEGPTQVEVQREATPIVAFAYLDAFDATGDRAIKTRQDLFARLKFSLTVHEQMEEAVL